MDDLLAQTKIDLTPEEKEKVHQVLEVAGGILLSIVERMITIASNDEGKANNYVNQMKGTGIALDVLTFVITEVVKPKSVMDNRDKVVAAMFCLESLRKSVVDIEADYVIALEKQKNQN